MSLRKTVFKHVFTTSVKMSSSTLLRALFAALVTFKNCSISRTQSEQHTRKNETCLTLRRDNKSNGISLTDYIITSSITYF